MVLQEKKKKCFKTARAASLGSWLQSQLLGWLPCSFSSLGTTPPLLSSKTTTFQLSGAAVYYQSEAWHSAFLSRDLGEQLAGILIRSLSASWLQWAGRGLVEPHTAPPRRPLVCLSSIILTSWEGWVERQDLQTKSLIIMKASAGLRLFSFCGGLFFWATLNIISSLVVSGPKNVRCHMNAWRVVPLYPLSSSDLGGNVKGNF